MLTAPPAGPVPQAIAEVCAACNEASIEYTGKAFRSVGAPTEAALKVLAEKLGVADAHLTQRFKMDRQRVRGLGGWAWLGSGAGAGAGAAQRCSRQAACSEPSLDQRHNLRTLFTRAANNCMLLADSRCFL